MVLTQGAEGRRRCARLWAPQEVGSSTRAPVGSPGPESNSGASLTQMHQPQPSPSPFPAGGDLPRPCPHGPWADTVGSAPGEHSTSALGKSRCGPSLGLPASGISIASLLPLDTPDTLWLVPAWPPDPVASRLSGSCSLAWFGERELGPGGANMGNIAWLEGSEVKYGARGSRCCWGGVVTVAGCS